MSLRHRWRAADELLGRYRTVWAHFWQQRGALDAPALQPDEAEFLPAALAIQASPVSPTARLVAWTITALVFGLLLWSIVGRVDIIVNGQGKIIPTERTKTIAAVEVASVRALHVREGQAVKAGDLLVELDTRGREADADKAEGEWQNAHLQAARSRALLASVASGQPPQLTQAPAIDPLRWRDAQWHLDDQWRDYAAKRDRLDGEIRRYRQALRLAERRAEDYAELARTQDVAHHAWLEKEQQRIDLEGQLNEAVNQRGALLAETRRHAQETLNEALRTMAAARQDLRRARVHGEWLRLVSPVDGTVQQLTTHTVGAAVPAAQPLMQIVPAQGVVELEAFVENKDIGFVAEGQSAEVKLDAFEYTKFGTVPATVTHVSRDAIEDTRRGLIYAVRVELARPSLRVHERDVVLSPGLSASVEIKTGSRRVIEYVLAPLLQHARESLRER